MNFDYSYCLRWLCGNSNLSNTNNFLSMKLYLVHKFMSEVFYTCSWIQALCIHFVLSFVTKLNKGHLVSWMSELVNQLGYLFAENILIAGNLWSVASRTPKKTIKIK